MNKYKLGILEDNPMFISKLKHSFSNDFYVDILDNYVEISTVENLIKEINKRELDAIVVDYKFTDSKLGLTYDGDDVMSAIDKYKKYFPIVLLTAFVNDAEQKVDDAYVVFDKAILTNKEQLDELIRKIIIAINNYKRKLNETEKRVKYLEIKQSLEPLTGKEEDELIKLHVELQYMDPESNSSPLHLLKSQSLDEISDMLKTSKEMLNLLKKNNESEDDICASKI